ncbi:uncharacterized protein LOC121863648 [Homarus americanus]|uniref:uncharacterized protein LOC121863648 n=1 Tax=Homarus americanus TaxID=6706 RepID=UPI001C45725E|nr:uncharacterized protein LOC121863648 [Homarus americanus]
MEEECQGCSLNYIDLNHVMGDEDLLRAFLLNHRVVKKFIKCPTCNTVIYPNHARRFVCNKVVYQGRKPNMKKTRCRLNVSALEGTLFEQSNFSFQQILTLIYWFLIPGISLEQVVFEVGLTQKVVIDCFNVFRVVTCTYCETKCNNLGGPGTIVEIDEIMFGSRKDSLGHAIEGYWVLGGIQRGTRRVFLVIVKDRTEQTLLAAIKRCVLPGTVIITDDWKGYKNLQNEGYEHRTAIHSNKFAESETESTMQNIQRLWRDVKEELPSYGWCWEQLRGHLATIVFRKTFPTPEERLHAFLVASAVMFPTQ